MAYAKICDRCKKVYAKNIFVADFGNNRHGTVKGVCVMFEEAGKQDDIRNAYLDLCDDCGKELDNFLAIVEV